MASRAMNTFNKLKNQGMSDSEAMEKAFGLAVEGRAKVREADKKKREKHSPAGKKYLAAEQLRRSTRHSPAVVAGEETMKVVTASRRKLNKIRESLKRKKK